jgi:hypothetical protein
MSNQEFHPRAKAQPHCVEKIRAITLQFHGLKLRHGFGFGNKKRFLGG